MKWIVPCATRRAQESGILRAMRRLVVLAVLCACHAPKPKAPMTWPAIDAKLLEDSAATFNFRLGTPIPLAVTPDGAVLFRRTPPRAFAADLYELDTKTGAVKTLVTAAELLGTGEEHLSNEEKARRERTRTATRGVVDIDVGDDGRTVMVPLGGKLHLVERPSGARRVVDPRGAAYDPHLSPDATKIAFVRDGDLWVIDAKEGAASKQLTHHEPGVEYGVADFAAQEELDRRRGFWWSPDSKLIAYEVADNRDVDTIYVSDARHPEKAPVPFKYPRAGRPNAKIGLKIVEPDNPSRTYASAFPNLDDAYLARVAWTRPAPTLVTTNREQTNLIVSGVDKMLAEHDSAWLNLPRPNSFGYTAGLPLFVDDTRFLWTTERTGAWTLELHDGADVKPLTTAEFGLRALVNFDALTKEAIVEASTDPTMQDIYRVPLDGGAPKRVATPPGVSGASFQNGVLVVSTALRDGGRRIVAIANGRELEIPSVAEHPSLVPTTQLETVEIAGRTHRTAITRPRAFVDGRKYPVILEVYAGPHAQTVLAARDAYVMDQFYADAGFVVVRSDGRGTPNRGRAWERAISEDLITIPMQDQIDALRAMGARHPEMDLSRVGVVGWSFGGYFSTMAVLLHPEVFACAIAGAPVTDWQLYDTAYTERYMRTPERNVPGYERTSALTHAAKLSRPLLLIHGITDDNVHFAHTLALIEALYVAGKRAEVITLSSTHMLPDPKLALAREQVQLDFFRQHLGPP
jgi:dipeptidyl-peptidase-4